MLSLRAQRSNLVTLRMYSWSLAQRSAAVGPRPNLLLLLIGQLKIKSRCARNDRCGIVISATHTLPRLPRVWVAHYENLILLKFEEASD